MSGIPPDLNLAPQQCPGTVVRNAKLVPVDLTTKIGILVWLSQGYHPLHHYGILHSNM